MNYQQACEFLTQRLVLGIQPGLERMQQAAAFFANHQQRYKTVLVAGTNGKGSTTQAISQLLTAQGYRVGTYLSPHLVHYSERFLINGQEIPLEEFARQLEQILASGVLDQIALTEFELLTLLAFRYFAEQQVDYAILEVGLGGRWDATNIVDAECAVITPIGLDHCEILGNTLAAIALEKAGIIKKDRPVFSAVQEKEALNVLQEKAISEYAKLDIVEKDSRLSGVAYQQQNLALARAVTSYLLQAEGRNVPMDSLSDTLKSFQFPGRFELVSTVPLILLDGAHNALGMRTLLQSLANRYPGKNITLMLGILQRKAARDVLAELVRWEQKDSLRSVVLVGVPNAPCYDPETLRLELESQGFVGQIGVVADPMAAVQDVRPTLSPDDLLVICGSLYLVGWFKRESNFYYT